MSTMSDFAPASLSPEAFADLKEIVLEEFGPDHTDQEIEEMGLRVLHLFNLLNPKETAAPKPKVSQEEAKALNYIEVCCKDGKTPTVRGVAEAIGNGHRDQG